MKDVVKTGEQTMRLAAIIGVSLILSSQQTLAAPALLADFDVTTDTDIAEDGFGPFNVAPGLTVSSASLTGLGEGDFTGFFHTTGHGSSQDLNRHMSFMVTPNSGGLLFDRVETILYNYSPFQPGTPTNVAIRSNADSFASNIDTGFNSNPGGHQPVTLDLSSLGAQQGPTEFRLYYWGQGEGGWPGSGLPGSSGPGFEIYGEAAPDPPTLEDLFAGETVTADDKFFSNWTLVETPPQVENGGVVDLTKIEVTPLTDDPLNPGIKFTAADGALGTPSSHTGPSSASLHFSYTVETTSGRPLIKDNSLLLNDFLFDAGSGASIRISETIAEPGGNPLGDKLVFAAPGDTPGTGNPNHFDSADFALQSALLVETLIVIEGPGDNDLAALRMFEQRFSQVPEPTALTTALLGVLGLVACSSRSRRRKLLGTRPGKGPLT